MMKMDSALDFSPAEWAAMVRAELLRSLDEVVARGNLTTSLIASDRRGEVRVLTRERAVLCGAPWDEAVARHLDLDARIVWHDAEGARCTLGQTELEFSGASRALLMAEGTAW